jgi:hypothetical protein
MEDSRTAITPSKNEEFSESRSLDKLYTALAKPQLEMLPAKTGSNNPFFKSKYADLASIVKASRTYLGTNGLAVIQRIVRNGSAGMTLLTRLCHSSGQWIESSMTVNPPKQDIQSLGSYLTYLRRYTYSSIVGVVACEEYDDGEAAIGRSAQKPVTKP